MPAKLPPLSVMPGDSEPIPFVPPPMPSLVRKQNPAAEKAVQPRAAKANGNAGERAQREEALHQTTGGNDARPPGSTLIGFCSGNAPWWLNVLCCPLVMVWQSFAIYVLSCCAAYSLRCTRTVFCCACRIYCRSAYLFRDKKFPPEASSIGNWENKSPEEVAACTEWVRAEEALELAHRNEGNDSQGPDNRGSRKRMTKLFEDKIEPRDIQQGGVGDCWLMAALACLAEHPSLLRHAFHGAGLSERGKYYIRLFDGRTRKWQSVVIDDYIPIDKSSRCPLFAKPNGHEIWVLLVEKAFAKWCGSYQGLHGGHEMWAFEALTGGCAFTMKRHSSQNTWCRMDLVHKEPSAGVRAIGVRPRREAHDSDDMFNLVRTYSRRGALMSASIANAGEEQRASGLVAGHAYSVLDAKSFTGANGQPLRLIQLRNPWGQMEWQGAWSDGDSEWQAHPKIKRLIRPAFGNDGAFWISWEDFSSSFDGLDICDRDRGLGDLALDAHERDGNCCTRQSGPLLGCLKGCATFWCCCFGCRALYCSRRATDETVRIERGKDDDLLDQLHIAVTRRLGIPDS